MRNALSLALLLALLGGCGLSEPLLLTEEPALQEVRLAPKTGADWTVEVDVEVFPQEDRFEDQVTLQVDSAVVRDGVVAALNHAGVFRESLPAGAGRGELTLALEVRSAWAEYIGSNENRLPWALVWICLSSIPAAWIADEEYRGELGVQAALLDGESGETLWTGSLDVSFQGALDHFQRGICFWDFLAPGPVLAPIDAQALGRTLLPHLQRQLEIALATRLASETPAKQAESDEEDLSSPEEDGDAEDAGDGEETEAGGEDDGADAPDAEAPAPPDPIETAADAPEGEEPAPPDSGETPADDAPGDVPDPPETPEDGTRDQ